MHSHVHAGAYLHTQVHTYRHTLISTDTSAPLHCAVFSHVTSLLPPWECSSSPVPQLGAEEKTPGTIADLHHTKGSYTNAQTLPSWWSGFFSPWRTKLESVLFKLFLKKKSDCILIVLWFVSQLKVGNKSHTGCSHCPSESTPPGPSAQISWLHQGNEFSHLQMWIEADVWRLWFSTFITST